MWVECIEKSIPENSSDLSGSVTYLIIDFYFKKVTTEECYIHGKHLNCGYEVTKAFVLLTLKHISNSPSVAILDVLFCCKLHFSFTSLAQHLCCQQSLKLEPSNQWLTTSFSLMQHSANHCTCRERRKTCLVITIYDDTKHLDIKHYCFSQTNISCY